jgi:hypothetical protein
VRICASAVYLNLSPQRLAGQAAYDRSHNVREIFIIQIYSDPLPARFILIRIY